PHGWDSMTPQPAQPPSEDASPPAHEPLPLDGIRVIEFSHMVMGPSCGMILADLGAEVIKVEPRGPGAKTRYLPGSGSGLFPAFNRNKHSVQLDIAEAADRGRVLDLIDSADVLLENFRVGKMESIGFGYEELSARNPGLIYCSLKGFLSGPYGNRAALDEVVQMLGGLAYMTGAPEPASTTSWAECSASSASSRHCGSARPPAAASSSTPHCSRTTPSSSAPTWPRPRSAVNRPDRCRPGRRPGPSTTSSAISMTTRSSSPPSPTGSGATSATTSG